MEPVKKQKRKINDKYTLMLIPHNGKESKSYNFRSSVIAKIGIVFYILLFLGIIGALRTSIVVYDAYASQHELAAYRSEKSIVVYDAYASQHELAAYRSEKAVQEQKLADLQKENEKMQQEMAEISALENEVRKELGNNKQPSRGGIDRSQYMGQGGPIQADIKMIDVYAAQTKNLQAEIQQKKENLSNLLAQLKERNARLNATPDIWPTEGGSITSYFGGRANPFSGYGYDYHPGIDIGNDYGAIYAGADGHVEFAGWFGGYGRYVKISHGYGYETAYGHMSSIAVSSGDYVKKGEVIGYVGSSGYSTGPHLHYEVIINGQDSDPLELIH